jgi:hypothetical protein
MNFKIDIVHPCRKIIVFNVFIESAFRAARATG